MRGLSQSRDTAAMVGIDHRKVARMAVMIGIGLSGLAGAALAPVYSVQPTWDRLSCSRRSRSSSSAAWATSRGPRLCDHARHCRKPDRRIPSVDAGEAAGFIAMILVLLFRPEGLFGRGVRV